MKYDKLVLVFSFLATEAWGAMTMRITRIDSMIMDVGNFGGPQMSKVLEDGYTPRKSENDLTKEAIAMYGKVITPGIFNRMDINYNMISSCENIHKKIFQNVSSDEQAILFGQALMEGRELFPIISRTLVPKLWWLIKNVSFIGKYTLEAASPFLSSAYAYLENNPKYKDIAFTFNIASLIAFQFGAYAFRNIYDYSSNLSMYYSNVILEKQLLKATINYKMPHDERHELRDFQKPSNPSSNKAAKDESAYISDKYFDVYGKVGSELARTIIKEKAKKNSADLLEDITKARNATSLKKLYRLSNVCSWGAGIFRAASGVCGMTNTVLGALAIAYGTVIDDDSGSTPKVNSFVIPQIISAAASIAFCELAKLFKLGAGNFSRRIIVYPVYNDNLLQEVKEEQQLLNPDNVVVVDN